MSSTDLTYARSRLRLGMAGVGLIVTLATVGLITGAPERTLPDHTLPPTQEAGWLTLLFLTYAVVQGPFDLLGGWILPRRHGREVHGAVAHLVRWMRGVATQGAVLVASCLVMLDVSRRGGDNAAWLSAAGLMVLLVALQGPLARLAGGFGAVTPAPGALQERVTAAVGRRVRVRFWEAADEGFTGGWFGLPGAESLVLPARWWSQLSPDALDAAALRRAAALRSGARSRGLLLALVFNTAGLVLASQLPGAGFGSVAQLATTALGVTLWNFVGLLVLPSASRQAVLAADASAQEMGATSGSLTRAIDALDRWQDDEPSRSPLVETIFHPVPSVERRLAALDERSARPGGAWHAARMALFLSWGALGLLPRAVHCNAGRPQLWVALPAD